MAHKYNLFPTHFKKIELDPASNLSVDNFKKILTTLMGQHLSLRYGQVILVTGCSVLTAVNLSQHECAISGCTWAPKLAKSEMDGWAVGVWSRDNQNLIFSDG